MKSAHSILASFLMILVACVSPKVFSPPGGDFSVEFPSTPKEDTHTANTPIGPVSIRMFMHQAGTWVYMVGYSDYPNLDNGADKALDGARDGAVKSTQGTLLSEEIISVQGHPARELRMEAAKGMAIRIRLICVGVRLYQVGVVTPKEDAYSPKIMRFIDSFHLSKTAKGA